MGAALGLIGFLGRFRERNKLAFYAGMVVALLILLNGLLFFGSFLLPEDFCWQGAVGNCAAALAKESGESWAKAEPVGIVEVALGGLGGRGAVVNNAPGRIKIARVRLRDVDDNELAFEFSGQVLLQPGDRYPIEFSATKECGGKWNRRLSGEIEYVSFNPTAANRQAMEKRLFAKCA